jgi:hypothetical protein
MHKHTGCILFRAAVLLAVIALPAAAAVSLLQFQKTEVLGGDPSYRSYSASAADYDGDGFIDIYVVNYLRGNYLYLNNGDSTFTEVGEEAGVAEAGKGVRSAWSDYDRDGDMDLFVVNALGDGNRLYRNEGDGTFKDMTLNAGVRSPAHSSSTDAAWSDYDRDGYPDLYVVENGHLIHEAGLPNILYRNNGDGTFQDVAEEAGLLNYGAGISASWEDYDLDGYPDLYVTNFTNLSVSYPDNLTNTLYRNNGDGTFGDVTLESGAYDGLGGYYAAWGDYDNDGLPDLYVANLKDVLNSSENSLFRNQGNGTFIEVGDAAGVRDTASSVSAAWSDLDLDGDLDLFITNYESGPFYALYLNNGDGTFQDVIGSSGIDTGTPGQWPVAADFSNDGYPDIFIPGVGYENVLYVNDAGAGGLGFSSTPLRPQGYATEAGETTSSGTPDGFFDGVKEATCIDSNTILVTWDRTGAAGNDRFNIYAASEPGQKDTESPIAVADPGTGSWMAEGLEPDTLYYVGVYRVSYDEILTNDAEVIVRTLPPSYEADVRPVFMYGCVHFGCHYRERNAEGLVLGEGVDPENLINIASRQNPSMNRITPFDGANSYLLHKITGTQSYIGGYGERMPYQRIDPLRDEEIGAVREWIGGGAKSAALSVYLNSQRFTGNETVSCFLNVAGAEGTPTDLYLALRHPNGRIDYLAQSAGGVYRQDSAVPFMSGWSIVPLNSQPLFQMSGDELVYTGTHELSAWLAPAGLDGSNPDAWVSNRSTLEFYVDAGERDVSGDNLFRKSGCFIATAAFGDHGAASVRVLREFRDTYLLSNKPGRWLISRYYNYSPVIAERISGDGTARTLARFLLYPLVCLAWLSLRAGGTVSILALCLPGLLLLFGLFGLRVKGSARKG